MNQEEIKRMLRAALIADWDDQAGKRRAAIVAFCAKDVCEHIPLSTMQDILPRLCGVKQALQSDLEALWHNLRPLWRNQGAVPSTFDIDDLVRVLVSEVVNFHLDWMKLTDIDDYD